MNLRLIMPYCPETPGRVPVIAKYLNNVTTVGFNREYNIVHGFAGKKSVFVCSTGIGGPSAAIAVEELYQAGVRNFIRVGTCGGININVKGGDIVIPMSSVRQEGTSLQYAPIEYPATADYRLVKALVESAENIDNRSGDIHVGVIQCKDSFYGQHSANRMPVRTELNEKWEAWKFLGVLASEMESSTIFTVAASLGCKAATVLSVVWNQERDKMGLPNREVHDIETACKIAIKAIRAYEN